MAKHAVNGSDKFEIILVKGAETIVLDFKTHYQALREFDKGIASVHKLLLGDKVKKSYFIDYEWEIDFSGAMDKPEGLLINQLKNKELVGYEIYLKPHTDVWWRIIQVQIIEDQRKLGTHTGINPYNKDYVIKFENVQAITSYNWEDPDDVHCQAIRDWC